MGLPYVYVVVKNDLEYIDTFIGATATMNGAIRMAARAHNGEPLARQIHASAYADPHPGDQRWTVRGTHYDVIRAELGTYG